MKLTRGLLALSLSFSLGLFTFLAIPFQSASSQDSKIALQRGYRTGYSDGYMAGYRDSIDSLARNHTRHGEYGKANRAYNREYGSIEDYSDGYKQGFEAGYSTGFDKRSFDAVIPETLTRRGNATVVTMIDAPPATAGTAAAETASSVAAETKDAFLVTPAPEPPHVMQKTSFVSATEAVVVIPQGAELIVELQSSMGTETSNEGDKFIAKVVSPAEIAGALVEGRVSKIVKPGRIKRRSELALSFDRIILTETRWSNFNAVLTEVLPSRGDGIRRVDDEGTALGQSSYKKDAVKVGAATGTGAVIGGVTGGPVGAAVGGSIGAAFGVGAVVIDRGRHIKLAQAQQLRMRTSYETMIR
jgi:hypothetical protein